MTNWYWNDGGMKRGPISSAQLRRLAAQGQVTPRTTVWREGSEQPVTAGRIQGLFETPQAPPAAEPAADGVPPPREDHPPSAEPPKPVSFRAPQVLRDVRSVNFRTEVVPIDGSNLPQILTDYAFWGVVVLAIGPQLITTLSGPTPLATQNLQLTAFALLFAGLWGVIFKYFMLRTASG